MIQLIFEQKSRMSGQLKSFVYSRDWLFSYHETFFFEEFSMNLEQIFKIWSQRINTTPLLKFAIFKSEHKNVFNFSMKSTTNIYEVSPFFLSSREPVHIFYHNFNIIWFDLMINNIWLFLDTKMEYIIYEKNILHYLCFSKIFHFVKINNYMPKSKQTKR